MISRYIVVGLVAATLAATARGQQTNVDQRLDQLEQEIRILKRQRELEEEDTAQKAQKAPIVRADEKGFSLSSADGAFQLKLRGWMQADARWFFDDDAQTGTDGFLVRRVRPIIEGTLWKDFDFRITPDFGGSSVTMQELYLGWNHWPELRLRTGRFKPPVGLERLQSGTVLALPERAFPTELLPNRDIGVQVHGALWDGVIEYAAGVFNGVAAGSSGTSNPSDDLEFAGRLFTHPFRNTDIAPLRGLGVGVAGTIGPENGTPASPQVGAYRTPGQQRFFRYRSGTPPSAANTVVADGDRRRLSPQGYYYWGAFGLLGEYAISEQEVSLGGTTAGLQHEAWQVTASWVVTGEAASYKGVKPKKPFDLENGGWGAFELVGRYHELDIDQDAFPTFADPSTAASAACGWGIGLNWYLNHNLKAAASYSQTRFDGGAAGGADRPDEQVLFIRLQVSF